MCEEDYIVVIDSASINVAGYSHHPLNYADSDPGKIKFISGDVGRNIAHNLALLGRNAWLLNVIDDGSYGQSLLAQTNQFGAYADECLVVPGENTSSCLSLLDNTGEMLVAISDISISDCISAGFPAQHQEFTRGAKVIVTDCSFSEGALVWVLENSGEMPIFIDPVLAWKCVKIRDHLSEIHTLRSNHSEVKALNGIVLSGRGDVAKVTAWFHQHDLSRLVFSMGGDGVYYSDINGESRWSAPIETNVIGATGAGDAMMTGLTSCWVNGMPFIDSVRFVQGCSSMTLAREYTNSPELSVVNVTSLVESTECLN